jgi:hypothetical protein
LRDAATLLIAVLIGSGAAFYNRYPLIYPDTGGYIVNARNGIRSTFYALFVIPANLTHVLWTVVLLQSLLVVYLLRLVLHEVFGIRSRLQYLAIIVLLCLLTSLPWYVAFVMPDIFVGVTVLGLFMLAFCFERLSRWERCFVVGVTFGASLTHFTYLPIAIGLLGVGLVARLALRSRVPALIPHLMLPGILIGAGVVTMIFANYIRFGLATYSPGGYAFEFGRLVQDGPAVAYLRENCPTRHYAACAYLDRMPMRTDDFLWAPDGLFKKIGFIGERKEGTEIVAGSIEEHPLWVMRDAIAHWIRQLQLVRTGDGLHTDTGDPYTTADLRSHYPAEYDAFLNSRQSRSELISRLHDLRKLHWNFTLVSAFYCCFIAVLLAKDRQWLPIALMVTVACAILLNAFFTGAISEPVNRYGSRIIWLVGLIALASWRKALGLSDATR